MRSGIFIRAVRDGEARSIDFCELTDAEMLDFANSQSIDLGFTWAVAMAKWIEIHVGPLPVPTEEEEGGPYGMFYKLVTDTGLIEEARERFHDTRGWELACLIGAFIRDAVIDNDPSSPPPVNELLIIKDALTYQLLVGPDGTPGFYCKNCQKISYNPTDYKMRYCGECKTFHE